ncbi:MULTISPECIES: VOC family protein [unclassified Streptomyces]|uniref:VOC family protein n=1 Tax=unclassified Streptomyces TaxID=2593676 RepID=UPI002E29E7EC|nr:VOC family protein [Streptomyces sp. NBC_01429]
MPEVTTPYATGTPCWVDLSAKDQQAALDFYQALFDWKFDVGPAELDGHAVCEVNGKAVAAIGPAMPSGEGMTQPPTAWITYLASTDAEATGAAIDAAGGTVLYPVADVADRGRMLIAADPQGAVFGVWQPGKFSGAQVVNEPGSLSWSELHTSDVPAAAAFYSEVFGIEMTLVEGLESEQDMRVGGRTFGTITSVTLPDMSARWLPFIAVDDADASTDALARQGGMVLIPPSETRMGRTTVTADREGAAFAMIRPKSK